MQHKHANSTSHLHQHKLSNIHPPYNDLRHALSMCSCQSVFTADQSGEFYQ